MVIFFFIINAMIVGYATLMLINFSIEDEFMQPIVYGISNIWGPEFAKSAAWLMISSLTALVFAIMQKKLAIKNTEFYNISARNKLLNISFSIGLLLAFSYVLITVYSYFSGESDPVGLYRVASTITMICIGLSFIWFEKCLSPKLNLSKYLCVFAIFLLICVTTGTLLTFKYASPTKMRQVKNDLRKFYAIESMAYLIKDNFSKTGVLPNEKISILEENNDAQKDRYKDIEYRILSDSKFQLCVKFDTNYNDARRITYYHIDRFYKAGEHCLTFTIAKQKSGAEINIINNNNIKISLQ